MSDNFSEGAAWGQLLKVHAVMMRRLEEMLQTRFGIAHGEFEVLLRLSWATGTRMRIRDLADASVLTRSGMSRLVDRLEAAGLVRRETAAEDARGAYAQLTPAGKERLDAAEAANIAMVHALFLDIYTPEEQQQMAGFWARFLEHASAEAAMPSRDNESARD